MVPEKRPLRLLASLIMAAGLAMPLAISSGPVVNAASPGEGGPLTPRLQLLADPMFDTWSPQAQAAKLFPPASGPGSIMERPGRRILVDVRVTDTSATTLAALRATGTLFV